MNQQDFEDAFTLMLSGAAEVNDRGIKWKDENGIDCYISFPTLSVNEAIVAQNQFGKVWVTKEYLNGMEVTISHKLLAQKNYCKNNNLPFFAPNDGFCFSCHNQVFKKVNFREASSSLITGCNHCHRSFCD